MASWLRSQGFKTSVPADRAWVAAAGTAAQAERAFKTTLNDYSVAGRSTQAAATDHFPSASLAGAIRGVSGLDNTMATPTIVRDNPQEFAAATAATPDGPNPIPPAPGFANAQLQPGDCRPPAKAQPAEAG